MSAQEQQQESRKPPPLTDLPTTPSTGTSAVRQETRNPAAAWKHVFAFTKWKHALPLALALLATCATSAIKSALALVIGKIFNLVVEFGAGGLEPAETLKQVSTWCLILAGMGLGAWIANGGFMATWVVFGELQARAVRDEVFSSLLIKELAWYDAQQDGIASLLVRAES